MKNLAKLISMAAVVLMATATMSCSDKDDGDTSGTEFTLGQTSLIFSATGGSTTLYVQASSTPTLTTTVSWLTITAVSTTSTKTFPYTITAEEYDDTDDRSATITVKVGSETQTVSVTQTAADGLILEQTSYDVSASGGDITVALTANGDFTATPSADWITDTGTRANMESYNAVFTIASNPGTARTGTISFTLNDITESVTINQEAAEVNDITATAADIAALMYPGWNLGNTLEAGSSSNLYANAGTGTETYWQSTKTTQTIIDYVKELGFKSVRIPCSWMMGHISDATDYTIDSDWMARVKEIVDYCIADGLYVILNDHWDGGWIEVLGFSESESSYSAVSESTIATKISLLKNIWTQIAEEFKDYDEHLLFAGLNEPFQEYTLFNSRHATLTPILNQYNQAFVDAVRATGGNNTYRTLVVQGPSTSISSTVDTSYGFEMPEDTMAGSGYLMVEVHYYEPWDFCGGTAYYFWGSANHVSGSSYNSTWGEESWVSSQFSSMKSSFVDKGYPVVIGEYGANWRELSSNQDEHNASIKSFFYEVNRQAVNNGMIPFVWDVNSTSRNGTTGTMTIINRASLSVYCSYAMDGITEGVAAATWPN